VATLTTNLFWGQGDRDHRLYVTEGHWPTDMVGSVFIVGPDKRQPGGHWFAEQGLLCKIHLVPDSKGRVVVQHRRIRTPLDRIRARAPQLFKTLLFMELSPFGLSNLANTNVQPIDDRLFIGYDAGRPLEVDPETMEFLTPVGANDEWLQSLPGTLEPGISVAAHPAADHEDRRLWFVNYSPMPINREVSIAAWDLEGPIRRWRISGMSEFDSIHDIKVTEDFLVFTDLPFVTEPQVFQGLPPTRPNKDTTTMWIVSKADLAGTPVGGTVPCREVILPMPTGHLSVDYENPGGRIRVFLEHVPIQDLMIMLRRDEYSHFTGGLIDPNYEGLVTLAVQPGCVGRYVIDAYSGQVLDQELAYDDRFWGAVLATKDESSPRARARQGDLWYASLGYDPALVPETWWRLYADAGLHHLVDPHELPTEPIPAGLARFDREAMKVAEVFSFPPGVFAHPPTFVPRRGSTEPDDGYIVCVVHRDSPKEIWVFDAAHVEDGPLAVATAKDFNPPLLLHSCWMAPRPGRRPSNYKIPTWRDAVSATRAAPGVVAGIARVGRELAAIARQEG
jgi:carotenoid cleavage dioxygenase-like enzyme